MTLHRVDAKKLKIFLGLLLLLTLTSSAGRRIASVLNITQSISVSASFRPFCVLYTNGGCPYSSTLGQAGPTTYWTAKINDYEVLVPQALFKQIPKNATYQLGNFDITADFNSEFSFWFAADETVINASQVDLEAVIVHELTHGLGFLSNLNDWGLTYSDNMLRPYYDVIGTFLYCF